MDHCHRPGAAEFRPASERRKCRLIPIQRVDVDGRIDVAIAVPTPPDLVDRRLVRPRTLMHDPEFDVLVQPHSSAIVAILNGSSASKSPTGTMSGWFGSGCSRCSCCGTWLPWCRWCRGFWPSAGMCRRLCRSLGTTTRTLCARTGPRGEADVRVRPVHRTGADRGRADGEQASASSPPLCLSVRGGGGRGLTM